MDSLGPHLFPGVEDSAVRKVRFGLRLVSRKFAGQDVPMSAVLGNQRIFFLHFFWGPHKVGCLESPRRYGPSPGEMGLIERDRSVLL